MLDGARLIDAHVHVARLDTMRLPPEHWHVAGGPDLSGSVYDEDGVPSLAKLDALLDREGVDTVLLMSEHSPRVTGYQPIDDLLRLAEANPVRYRLAANVNPHLHYPIQREVRRQIALGALALKVHPVHGDFPANAREMYPAYGLCEEQQVPVVVHTGTSNFPGATNRFGDPGLIEDVVKDFPDLTVVLAHGGRGWWYEAATFLSLMRAGIWIDVAGLPPSKLPTYFAGFDLDRLAKSGSSGLTGRACRVSPTSRAASAPSV